MFLLLADTAKDSPIASQHVVSAADGPGIAFKFGKGGVVVLGEAAMLSAQLAGAEKRPVV